MPYVFIFAAIFISLYTGAFFYAGFKDFDYSKSSDYTHHSSTPQPKHTL